MEKGDFSQAFLVEDKKTYISSGLWGHDGGGEMGTPLFLVCIGHGMMPCTKMGHGRLGKLRGWRGKRGDEIGWEQGGWGQRRSTICGLSFLSL